MSECELQREVVAFAPSEPGGGLETLPIAATASDIRELLKYLERKPEGVTVKEQADRPQKRLFDEQKLADYELLGITTMDGSALTLTPFGWNFASCIEPAAQMFRYLLEQTTPYWSALKWIQEKKLELVTSADVVNFWSEAQPDEMGLEDYDKIKGGAVSFFSLCQAAVLGTMTLGKRGHMTRLSVDRDELARFLENGSHVDAAPVTKLERLARLRVRILQNQNARVVQLIQQTLEIFQIPHELIESVSTQKCAVDLTVNESPREDDALIFILDETSYAGDEPGGMHLKEKVLIEIGAAQVMYNGRVILFVDKRFPAPDTAQKLICYEFENDSVEWETGLKLISAINDFKLLSR